MSSLSGTFPPLASPQRCALSALVWPGFSQEGLSPGLLMAGESAFHAGLGKAELVGGKCVISIYSIKLEGGSALLMQVT